MTAAADFWSSKSAWPPIDPPGFIFLGRAVDPIGKSLFGESWTGRELLGSPRRAPAFADEAAAERARGALAKPGPYTDAHGAAQSVIIRGVSDGFFPADRRAEIMQAPRAGTLTATEWWGLTKTHNAAIERRERLMTDVTQAGLTGTLRYTLEWTVATGEIASPSNWFASSPEQLQGRFTRCEMVVRNQWGSMTAQRIYLLAADVEAQFPAPEESLPAWAPKGRAVKLWIADPATIAKAAEKLPNPCAKGDYVAELNSLWRGGKGKELQPDTIGRTLRDTGPYPDWVTD